MMEKRSSFLFTSEKAIASSSATTTNRQQRHRLGEKKTAIAPTNSTATCVPPPEEESSHRLEHHHNFLLRRKKRFRRESFCSSLGNRPCFVRIVSLLSFGCMIIFLTRIRPTDDSDAVINSSSNNHKPTSVSEASIRARRNSTTTIDEKESTMTDIDMPELKMHNDHNHHNRKQRHNSHPHAAAIKIACVGDSLTRGDIGQNITNGIDDYPTQLQQMLTSLSGGGYGPNIKFVVGNFGKNGATALRSVRASYDRTAEFKEAMQFHPNIVLLGLGTNDAKYLWSPELRAKHTVDVQSSLIWLIEQFYTKIPTIPKLFLAYRPPYVSKSFQKIQQETIETFLWPILDEVVKSNTTSNILKGNVDLYRITSNNKDETIFINDGLHLNHKGYGLVAQTWLHELKNSGVLEEIVDS